MKKNIKSHANQSLEAAVEKKSLFRFFLLVGLFLILTNSIILKPISIYINTNYLFKQGFLPYLLELLVLICDVLFYTVTFSALSYSICFFQTGYYLPIGYILMYALGKFLDVGVTWIINKYVHPILWFEIGIYFIISLAFLGVFYVMISLRMKRYRSQKAEIVKAKALLNPQNTRHQNALYPFERLFCRKNPLQWCAFSVSILLSLPFVVPKFIQIFQSASVLSEFLKALALFFSYALLSVISYFSALLFFAHFFQIKDRAKNDRDSVFSE